MLVILVLFRRDMAGLARVTRLALLANLAVEAAFVLVVGDQGYGRAVGTFNDPNQMGYWALLAVTCMLVLRASPRVGAVDLAALALAGCIIVSSVSRSALLGYGVLLLIVAVSSRVRPRVILTALALGSVALLLARALELGSDQQQEVLTFAQERFTSRDMANDNLAARGYGRLWQFPQHLVFGAGEAAQELRFNLKNRGSFESSAPSCSATASSASCCSLCSSSSCCSAPRRPAWRF